MESATCSRMESMLALYGITALPCMESAVRRYRKAHGVRNEMRFAHEMNFAEILEMT